LTTSAGARGITHKYFGRTPRPREIFNKTKGLSVSAGTPGDALAQGRSVAEAREIYGECQVK
jgi:hypothetical protein